MITFFRALSVEHLKLKRTLTVWMVLVAPFVVNLMYFLTMIDQGQKYNEPDPQAWSNYMHSVLAMWSILMLPLLITLESTLLSNIEYANQQWKHLFSLPLPRWSLFAAKWTLLFELILASSIINLGLALLGGWGTGQIFTAMNLTMLKIPLRELFIMNIKVFLGAILMISIHVWISLRWSSIVVSIGTGMVAVVGSLFIMRSDKWSPIYPWTLPFSTFNNGGGLLEQILSIAIIGGLLFGIFSAWEFSRREMM